MAENSLRQWLTTPASNTDVGGVTLVENVMKPSDVNNAVRAMMGQTAQYLVEMSYPTAGGTANALTLTPTTALAALTANQAYTFNAASANSTAATLAVSGLTAKAIRKIVGGTDVALAANDIQANGRYTVVYDTAANGAAGAWVIVSGTLFGVREKLAAVRTYYVRTDGSDSNTGLVDSAGGGFLTIQKAINTVYGLDNNGFSVTIQVDDGTFTGNAVFSGPFVGNGGIVLQGNTTTPANCIISKASGDAIAISNGAVVAVRGFKLLTTTSGYGLRVQPFCTSSVGVMEFGACADGQIIANGGYVTSTSNWTISGSTPIWINSVAGGFVELANNTVTLTGTPAWGTAGIFFDSAGRVSMFSVTISGSATGKRYQGTLNAVLNSFGAGSASTYFPGNSNGTTATGAQQA